MNKPKNVITLNVLFAQLKCQYPGQYAPEPLAVSSNYIDDENPDYMACEVKKAKAASEYESVRIISFDVDADEIDRLLSVRAKVDATIVEPTAENPTT